MRRRVLLALALLGGCQSRGHARVVFEWSDPPPADPSSLFLHLRVEERPDLDATGRALASSVTPLVLDSDVRLADVPSGDHRVLIAEVRDGPGTGSSAVLYRGISEQFDLHPGVEANVEVYVALSRTPSLSMSGVRIEEATSFGFVSSPRVTVLLGAQSAERIVLARDFDFTIDRLEAPAAEVAWGDGFRLSYDLCGTSTCSDGPAAVYAKVADRHGYESEPRAAEITLDTVAPGLVPETALVTLSPGPGNPLRTLGALGPGSTARVIFAATEPVVTPTVSAIPDGVPGEAIALSPIVAGSSAFTFELVAGSSALDGDYHLRVELEDRAGNRRTSDLPIAALTIDRTQPTALAPDALTYAREPWGTDDSGGRPRFSVEGVGEPGAVAIAYDAEDLERAQEIGRSETSTTGAFQLHLGGTDRDDVFVALADRAGNLSDASSAPGLQAARAGRIRWRATLGGKIPGRRTPNPHRAVLLGSARASLVQLDSQSEEPDRAGIEALSALDGASVRASSKRGWREWRAPTIDPQPAEIRGMAYDAQHDQLIAFGGEETGLLGREHTWRWDGARWLDVSRAGGTPPDATGDDIVFDAARGRILTFGAHDNHGQPVAETWTLENDSWTRTSTALPEPTPRSGGALAYDSVRGRVVLFGGLGHADTWVWEGAGWRELPGAGPPARSDHMMAFDAARGRIVLYGGYGDTGVSGMQGPLTDTWELDGDTWLPIDTGTTSPGWRQQSGFTYDAGRGRVVLFGGIVANLTDDDEVWEWDGLRWTHRAPLGPRPDPRHASKMAYDPNLHATVLIAGRGEEIPFPSWLRPDTWAWDGTEWSELTPNGLAPSARRTVIGYDEAHERAVLFGGPGLADTWTWNGWRWEEVTPPSGGPNALGALAYDRSRDTLVLFNGETWAWDGADWSMQASIGATDPLVAMGSGPGDGLVLLTGSGATSRTWVREDGDWREATPTGLIPAASGGGALAFDALHQRAVLFAGLGANADTWEWDGARWILTSPPVDPGARQGFGFTSDTLRGRAVLFGGHLQVGASELSDVWEWDGTRWDAPPITGLAPRPRTGAGVVHDPSRRELLVFGGHVSIGPDLGDTWLLDMDPEQRPGVLFAFDLGDAFATPTPIDALEIEAVAGAEGNDGPAAREGAELWLWDAWSGAWRSVAQNASPLDRPGELRASPSEPFRYVTSDLEVYALLVPKGTLAAGSVLPAVAADYLELELRFHR